MKKSFQRFAGIDPGVYGAVCVIDRKGKLLYLADSPGVKKSKKKSDLMNRFWPNFSLKIIREGKADAVVIEEQFPHPNTGKIQTAVIVFSYALWCGLCVGRVQKIRTFRPQDWKKLMIPKDWKQPWLRSKFGNNIPKEIPDRDNKQMSVDRAIEMGHPSFRKFLNDRSCDFRYIHGNAEAYLLAELCRQIYM